MSYDPTKKPENMDTSVDEVESKSGQSGTYKVSVSIKKSKKDLFKTYLNNIKMMDKHTFMVWVYGMWLNLSYVAVGLVGLLTLTWFVPMRWTAVPSLKQARQMAISKQEKRLKKEYEESLKAKETDDTVEVVDIPVHENKEDEMDHWLRKMRGDRC